jgi:hypothetical protein
MSHSDEKYVRQLAAKIVAVHARQVEIAQTIYACKKHRRTPQQISALLARARCAVRRAVLTRQRLDDRRRVH